MLDFEPWRGLSEAVADLIEPELAGDHRGDPGDDRPRGAGVRAAARGPLRAGDPHRRRRSPAPVRRPDPRPGRRPRPGREVYVELGRGEQEQGRTLDSLQAAYRVGARVAWRRIAAAGRRADLDPEALSLLAEAIFAYIDELSADSVEGYAEAQAEVEDVRRRRRRELARLLVAEQPADPAELAPPPKLPAGPCRDGRRARLRRAGPGAVGPALAAGGASDGARRDRLSAAARPGRSRSRRVAGAGGALRGDRPRPRRCAGGPGRVLGAGLAVPCGPPPRACCPPPGCCAPRTISPS